MTIENVQLNDREIIAKLHKKNLISPSSKIGEDYLKKLYKLLLLEPDMHICLLVRQKNEIMGVITVTKDLHKTNIILNRLMTLSSLIAISKAIFLKKVKIKEFFDRFLFEKMLMRKFTNPYPSILTLFVDHKYQRKGLGKKLIDESLKRLKKNGIQKVYVDTLISNKKAIVFYQAQGFRQETVIVDSIVLVKKLV